MRDTRRDSPNWARGQKDQVESNGSDLPTHLSPPLPVCAADGKHGELAQCWRQSNTDVQIHVVVLLLIWLRSEMGEYDSSVREWWTYSNWSHVLKNGKQSFWNHYYYYYFTTERCENVVTLSTRTYQHHPRLASTAALNKTWWICCRGCLAKHSLHACAWLQTERAGEPAPLFRETCVCRACARWHLSLRESRRITQGCADKWI